LLKLQEVGEGGTPYTSGNPAIPTV
jgi:hypothetical protein